MISRAHFGHPELSWKKEEERKNTRKGEGAPACEERLRGGLIGVWKIWAWDRKGFNTAQNQKSIGL